MHACLQACVRVHARVQIRAFRVPAYADVGLFCIVFCIAYTE